MFEVAGDHSPFPAPATPETWYDQAALSSQMLTSFQTHLSILHATQEQHSQLLTSLLQQQQQQQQQPTQQYEFPVTQHAAQPRRVRRGGRKKLGRRERQLLKNQQQGSDCDGIMAVQATSNDSSDEAVEHLITEKPYENDAVASQSCVQAHNTEAERSAALDQDWSLQGTEKAEDVALASRNNPRRRYEIGGACHHKQFQHVAPTFETACLTLSGVPEEANARSVTDASQSEVIEANGAPLVKSEAEATEVGKGDNAGCSCTTCYQSSSEAEEIMRKAERQIALLMSEAAAAHRDLMEERTRTSKAEAEADRLRSVLKEQLTEGKNARLMSEAAAAHRDLLEERTRKSKAEAEADRLRSILKEQQSRTADAEAWARSAQCRVNELLLEAAKAYQALVQAQTRADAEHAENERMHALLADLRSKAADAEVSALQAEQKMVSAVPESSPARSSKKNAGEWSVRLEVWPKWVSSMPFLNTCHGGRDCDHVQPYSDSFTSPLLEITSQLSPAVCH